MPKIVIIDPTSTEFNRGSFCYLPYILYSSLKDEGYDIELFEDFTVAGIDQLPTADIYLIALWSYPQIDQCLVLNRFIQSNNIKFFGYEPLIKNRRLPFFKVSNKRIERGIINYPNYYKDFKFILLSDCDMHLNKYSGTVYPLFTSYGCKNACSFCPVSINCHKERVIVPPTTVKTVLKECYQAGIKNIHFTDEDFFFDIDRTYEILSFLTQFDMKLISLSCVNNASRFVKKYGKQILQDSGMKLIEVGMETASPTLSHKMKKPPINQYKRLHNLVDGSTNIFWLTLTFYIGEDLISLNQTGEFLSEYGYDIKDLYGRLATNSSEGGLGQFFQPYHGTTTYSKLKDLGIFISDRPVRLIPSYIPNSFLESWFIQKRVLSKDDLKWFKIYNLSHIITKINLTNLRSQKIKTVIDLMTKTLNISIGDAATFLAICGRLRII